MKQWLSIERACGNRISKQDLLAEGQAVCCPVVTLRVEAEKHGVPPGELAGKMMVRPESESESSGSRDSQATSRLRRRQDGEVQLMYLHWRELSF